MYQFNAEIYHVLGVNTDWLTDYQHILTKNALPLSLVQRQIKKLMSSKVKTFRQTETKSRAGVRQITKVLQKKESNLFSVSLHVLKRHFQKIDKTIFATKTKSLTSTSSLTSFSGKPSDIKCRLMSLTWAFLLVTLAPRNSDATSQWQTYHK